MINIPKWNVAAYLRLSKEDNENMESNSIINQRELIEQYISGKNDLQLVDYYIDDGYSGTNFNRPGFRRLLQDMKNKKINCIIVKDLSRFARSHIEADMYFENIFPALNIRFISVIFIIDKEVSKNVIKIFNDIIEGKTASEIANELNRNNVLTPALYKIKNNNIQVDQKWNAKMINVILQNRVYKGDLIQGKKKVENYRTHKLISTNKDEWIITENHHEPIISKEKFDEVQEILNKNKCARSNKEKDLFYIFLKCADCGSSFTLRKVKNYEYYHCTSYVRNSSCTSHSIRKDRLIELVIEELNKKFKRNKIDTLTRDILLKNIDSIIIFQNGEVQVKFK